jgi:hypothetical protein
MNVSQLHERLRREISRRIERGVLTGTLLARQTGLQPSHISNFLHRKRKLSLAAFDRVLAAQMLSIEDLLPPEFSRHLAPAPEISDSRFDSVPIVSQATAAHSPTASPRTTIDVLHLPSGILEQLRPRRAVIRRDWQRFFAVRVTPAQALPMAPVLVPHAIVVLDRHYNSLAPYQPSRPNLYAVSVGSSLSFRYVGFDADRLILRPHALDHAVELLNVGPNESPSDFIVGRVCVCIFEI